MSTDKETAQPAGFWTIRHEHFGSWLLLLVLAIQSLHSIPQRNAYFSRLQYLGHDPAAISVYIKLMPLLFGAVYLIFVPMAWTKGKPNKWHFPSLSVPGTLVLGMVLATLTALDYGGFRYFFPTTEPPFPMALDFASIFAMCLGAGFFANLITGLDLERALSAARTQEAEGSLLEARARLIAAQIDPHVIFNTLAGAESSISDNPETARAMLYAASEYLKRLLLATKTDRIPLGQERALIAEYLTVEQYRMGERLTVQWDWPAIYDDTLIPPVLVQTLVENAIKHGIWPHRQGGTLRLSVSVDRSRLSITVANNGTALRAKAREGGVGLENLRARLGHAYGATAAFTLEARDSWTVATLCIPLEAACAA